MVCLHVTSLPVLSLSDNGRDKNRTSGRLNNGIPQVPPRRGQSELDHFRCSLPVYGRQEEIVQIIKDNRVILVLGETGSGKTTQVSEPGSTACWLTSMVWPVKIS